MPVYKQSIFERMFTALIYSSLFMIMLMTLYPFIYIISMSISEPVNVINRSVWLYPIGFSLDSYARVFANADLWRSYYNTIYYTVAGTSLNVTMTMLAAYPLSRGQFFLRKQMMIMIVITMFFQGGLIPMFILIQNLGLYDTRWAVLLPSAVGAFNIIVARSFLQSIPGELFESAKLDGANDIRILTGIVVPLSKPILAVLTLFYAVNHWNSFLPALMYLPSPQLQPLSIYLKALLIESSVSMTQDMEGAFEQSMATVQIKYAVIVVAILPIISVYPFLQKHFVKGVMIGSLKG